MLELVYGDDINNIDPWVGGLAEDHLPGSSVGELFTAVIANQFERLRDGDRFWYELAFDGQLLDEISNTTLADIIRRNTNITHIQNNVFFYFGGVPEPTTAALGRDGLGHFWIAPPTVRLRYQTTISRQTISTAGFSNSRRKV